MARIAVISWVFATVFACGGAQPCPEASGQRGNVPAKSAAVAPSSELASDPFPAARNLAPESYWVLGPFPFVDSGADTSHASLEHDYLAPLGGEPNARLAASAAVPAGGQTLTPKLVHAKASVVDFLTHYGSNTDRKVAYAYAELEVPEATRALALFGSDDAAVVWVNGRRAHRMIADRALSPDSDRFEFPLKVGINRLLVKVDNGIGGWGFALRLYDSEGQRRLKAIEARRNLERLAPEPERNEHLLGDAFPQVAFRDSRLAELVFGSRPPSVRWFGPDLEPAERPGRSGRYIALLEATTLDGYAYRRMLSFAKVDAQLTPWLPTGPQSETAPLIQFPPNVKATEAQRAELSRHVWQGGMEALWSGESSAIVASALTELQDKPLPADEPAWLHSGFIRNAAHQLALRMKLDARTPRELKPPATITPPASELRSGTERQAGMKPGTTRKLRQLARQWAKADPNEFVVLVARRGVVFMHEGFNGFDKDSVFYPASIGKTIAGLTFARAVDQGVIELDQTIGSVLSDWRAAKTGHLTFRHCFGHLTGLRGHRSHGGLFNAYLDNALFVQDALFAEPTTRFVYNGDAINLTGKALELVTGKPIWRLLYEQMQKPFSESVTQLDLGAGDTFSALYLAKIGQMLIQDGAYGKYRFYRPGFVKSLWPRRIAEWAPDFDDKEFEWGIGLERMIDPYNARERGERGVLGPNVVGHGAASGVAWRIAPDQDLIIVVGRNKRENWHQNEEWSSKLVEQVALNLAD